MPLYELFCMARPALTRLERSSIMRSAASTVLEKGGVLTDIKSYGDCELAYEIRRPGLRMSEVLALCKMSTGVAAHNGVATHANPCPPSNTLNCNRRSWAPAEHS